MTGTLGAFVLQLTGAAMISAAALSIIPEGRVKKAAELVCGFMMISVMLGIFTDFDYTYFSQNIARYKAEGIEVTENAEKENDRLKRLIIEEETEAYILDKGAELGIETLDAEVKTLWDTDGYWYPSNVTVSADLDAGTKEKLSQIIEADLGVPPDKQHWGTDDEN